MVAIVVGGHGHDGSSTVCHQNVVRYPDRGFFAAVWIERVCACEDTGLFMRSRQTILIGQSSCIFDISIDFSLVLVGGDLRHQQVLGRKHAKGSPEDCIDARGKNLEGFLSASDLPFEFDAFRAPDPVALL